MTIIGSVAIRHHFPDFPREPKDLDYAVDKPKSNPKGIEYLLNPIIANRGEYLSPDLLLTLKASHLFWDINWEKHMFDVQFLLKKGCIIDEVVFYELYEYWNVYHSKNKRSDLKMTAEDFFDNALNTGYAHDDIHLLLNPIPVYTKILKDGCEVEVCEQKFQALSFEDKCNLVYEEVENMGWERYPKLHYKVAYDKMLKKFIISHAPLWEALFIIENYILLHKTRHNYRKIINDGLKNLKPSTSQFA